MPAELSGAVRRSDNLLEKPLALKQYRDFFHPLYATLPLAITFGVEKLEWCGYRW